MAVCLNTDTAYKLYSMMAHDRYFVDKSGMIEMVSARINCMNRYLCITKPRRFGKTSVLNMLGAYYCKACDASTLFDGLDISRSETYKTHLNQYNVINLCLNRLPDQGSTYEDYIGLVRNAIKHDVQEAYPALGNREFGSIVDMLTATGEQFIFIIDEWNYIFSHELYPEHHGEFLEFLRNLLKDQPYVSLAYMTGVLPLKKYSTGSVLNMFKEYTMLKDPFFGEYFGFTQSEVEMLCKRQSALTMEEISDWYNGYQTRSGARLYNPRSVVCALEDASCQSYWTRACLKNHSCHLHAPLCAIFAPNSGYIARYAPFIWHKSPTNCDAHLTESIFQTRPRTGKMDEVLFLLKYNIGEVRDDVVRIDIL